MEGWSYHSGIFIPTVALLEANIVVQVNVTYRSAMQTDFGDIRFVDSDNETLLDQQLMYSEDGVLSIWFVKLPEHPVGGKTIWVWYGNDDVAIKNENVAAYWWRGELDKNIEVTPDGCAVGDYYADFNGGQSSLETVDAISTWHSVVVITLLFYDFNKTRWFGMGPPELSPSGGPLCVYQYFAWPPPPPSVPAAWTYYSNEGVWGSSAWSELLYTPFGARKLMLYRQAQNGLPVGSVTYIDNIITATGGNGGASAKVKINQSNNGTPLSAAMRIYGIEVFDLPQYVVDIDDWDDIEPAEEIGAESEPPLEVWKSVVEIESAE